MNTTAFDFYMYEIIDGGAGAIGCVPCELFVFNDGAALAKHLEENVGDVDGFDDESLEDFENRLGVDDGPIWVVKENTVVGQLDLADFVWLRRGAEATRISDVPVVEGLIKQGPDGLTIALDAVALKKALPKTKSPLTKSARPKLEWKVPRARSHVGDTVRLGHTELGSRQHFFWE